MHILDYQASSFRNLTSIAFEPSPGINMIFGANGQGKTNLIESIWLFTGCRSFRTNENAELIMKGQPRAELAIQFWSNAHTQSAAIDIQNQRTLRLNGFTQASPRRMFGVFPAVVFSPSTLAIVKGGPSERRRFLDIALSMIKPIYAVTLAKYIKALNQRNALLRKADGADESFLMWEEVLASEAASVMLARYAYLRELCPLATQYYGEISAEKERFDIRYAPAAAREQSFDALPRDELKARYQVLFERNRRNDLRLQSTTVGPHRDDLNLRLNGDAARHFASQGQQRSIALAMKLAEASILRTTLGDAPIALLDDVMSELDAQRQSDLLRFLDGWQVFLSCCEPSHLLSVACGKIFEMQNGALRLSQST
ncbi:MAG: DNA replication/repair protein RecF [Oscillospiraceae bacterium]|nr:DNA replication/repair protein RecF [Oscillospiraceae bacterium]